MSKRETGKRPEPIRNRIAGFLFTVLPATMVLGLLAPDVIETQLVAAQSAVVPTAPERVAWQPRHFKTPLLIPNEILIDHGLDLVDVNALLERFAQVLRAGRPEPDVRFAQLPGFQGPDDDTIVIDDVDDYVEEEIFEHSLEPGLKVDLRPVWPEFANVINHNVYAFGAEDGFTLFDDLVGEEIHPNATKDRPTIPPVPEPGTGTLLGFGLLLLVRATHRSRRR